MNEWIIFERKDGKLGMLPKIAEKNVSGEIVEIFKGSEAQALKRIYEIEAHG